MEQRSLILKQMHLTKTEREREVGSPPPRLTPWHVGKGAGLAQGASGGNPDFSWLARSRVLAKAAANTPLLTCHTPALQCPSLPSGRILVRLGQTSSKGRRSTQQCLGCVFLLEGALVCRKVPWGGGTFV